MTLHVILLEDTDTTENHTEIPQRKLTLTLSVSSDWDGEGVCGGGGGGGGGLKEGGLKPVFVAPTHFCA